MRGNNMNNNIKKIDADSVCDKTIISNKIAQAKAHLKALENCVDVIDMLDDGNLHDQLSVAVSVMNDAKTMVRRFEEVHGNLHMLTDEARSAQIKKWAIETRELAD